MKRLLSIVAFVCLGVTAYAQITPTAIGGQVVASCGSSITGTTNNLLVLAVDSHGQLCINGSITGGNAAAGSTGAAVPAFADYQGVNIGGNLTGVTGFSLGTSRVPGIAIVDGSGNQITSFGGGTQYTQNTALTIATTIGTMAIGRASAAAPTDVGADDRAVIPWYLRSGAQAIQETYGGVLAVAGNGVSGTGVQRVTIASDSTGTVAATQSGTWNIGTVTTLTSITNPVSVNPGTAANWGIAATAGAVPANAIYEGINVAGNVRGRTGVNPSGSVFAAQTDITSVNGTTIGPAAPLAVRASDGTNYIADAAVGAAVTSNPVPSGCENETSPTAISSGQAGILHCTTGQLLMVSLFNGTNQTPAMDAIARRGFIELSDGTNGQAVDPCQDAALTKANINVRVAGTSLTSLIAAQSSKTTYICWLKIEADGTSEIASVIEAAHTSTACDGAQTALEGNTTAANGIALGANGGFIAGNGGYAVYKTTAVTHEVCALDSGSNPVHYTGQWVAR